MSSESPAEGTVQCEVTGQWVPEDETVMFQGQRVCAEGKEILLERVKTGQLISGGPEAPTALRRFGSMFVDGVVMWVVIIAMSAALIPVFLSSPDELIAVQAGIGLVTSLLQFAYFTIMHGMRGQSLGKMAGKIKVIYSKGGDITMGTAAARTLYFLGPSLLSSVILAFAIVSPSLAILTAANIVNVAGGLYILVSIIMALTDRGQQRMIHDRLAGTRVVDLAN